MRAAQVWRRAAGQHLAVLVGQMLASGGNFVALVVASRVGHGDDFGAASLTFTAYALGGTLIRPFTGHVVQILLPRRTAGETKHRLHAPVILNVALLAGAVVAGTIAVAFGSGVPDRLVGQWLIALAAVPLLLVYDVTRYWLTTLGRPAVVAAIDASWLFCMIIVLILVRPTSAVEAMLCWAMAGLVAVLAGVGSVLHSTSAVAADRRWTYEQVHRLGGPMVAETGFLVATNWTLVLAAPHIVGLTELGRLQALDLVFGPVTMLTTALGLALQPRIADCVKEGQDARAWRLAAVAGTLLLAVASAIPLLLVVLPRHLWTGLLGLDDVGWLLIAAALSRAAAQAPQLSATILTRATRQFRAAIRMRLITCGIGAGGGVLVMAASRSLAVAYLVAYGALAGGSVLVLIGLRPGLSSQAERQPL